MRLVIAFMVYEAAVRRVLDSPAPAQNTQAWLAWRQSRLTASDVPIVVGNGVKGRQSLIDRKSGAEPRAFTGNEYTRSGHVNEPVAIAKYVDRTGRSVHLGLKPVVHPAYPGLAASLDGMTPCGRNVECKVLHADRACARPKPAHVYQAQFQMACAGLVVTDLIYYYVNLDGRLDVHTIDYDHEWFTTNLPRFKAFLQDLRAACACKLDPHDLLFDENDMLTDWPATPPRSPHGDDAEFSLFDDDWPPLSPPGRSPGSAPMPVSDVWTSRELRPLELTLKYPLDLSLPDAPAHLLPTVILRDDGEEQSSTSSGE